MKLQLDVPTTWTAEPLADGQRRYVVPGSPTATPDLVVLIRESLPLPLELGNWPQAALLRLNTAFLGCLPGELASGGAVAAAKRRVQVQSTAVLTTTSGWPAMLVNAILLNEHEQPIAGCLAALYRFLAYGAEAVVVATDRARFTAVRESLLTVLTTGRATWPSGEPPSLHHMLHDEPTTP